MAARRTVTDAPRPPAALLLPLVAGLAGSALLPGDWPVLVGLAVVLLLGVPHGALDGEVARPLLRPRFGRAWFLVFALPYLSLSALVLLAWRTAPLPTLAAFLAVSVWHFGSEDAGPGRPAEALVRGGLPVAAPVLLHPDATARVFGAAAGVSLPSPPPWLTDAALLWALAAAVAAAALWKARRTAALGEMAALLCAYAVLPPLTAFALYFVGIHAPRHMHALAAHPSRAPRVRTMRAAVLRSLPVTALTLVLGAALWPLYGGTVPDRLLALTLQGLAALTLPHLALEHWAAAQEARQTRRPAALVGSLGRSGLNALPRAPR